MKEHSRIATFLISINMAVGRSQSRVYSIVLVLFVAITGLTTLTKWGNSVGSELSRSESVIVESDSSSMSFLSRLGLGDSFPSSKKKAACEFDLSRVAEFASKENELTSVIQAFSYAERVILDGNKTETRRTKTGMDCEKQLSPEKSFFPTEIEPFECYYKFQSVRNATMVADTDWGFTCNKMHIIAEAVRRMVVTPGAKERALAFGPTLSELIWQLDLSAFSRDFIVLLDCEEFGQNAFVKCGSLVFRGYASDISRSGVYPVLNRFIDADLYWNGGPAKIGFHPILAKYILPSETLRRSVELAMAKLQSPSLGIHRRDMENHCYEYLGLGKLEYECHKDGAANPSINALSKIDTPGKFREKFYFKPLENDYPFLTTCNYTLDEKQLKIFHREWPNVFKPGRKLQILFTTDSNDKKGDEILKMSPVISALFKMNDLTTDTTCSKNKHRVLLYDMYGLALSDYHMGNALSTCDVTVVHWRRLLKKPIGTSYPTLCYDAYYNDTPAFR